MPATLLPPLGEPDATGVTSSREQPLLMVIRYHQVTALIAAPRGHGNGVAYTFIDKP